MSSSDQPEVQQDGRSVRVVFRNAPILHSGEIMQVYLVLDESGRVEAHTSYVLNAMWRLMRRELPWPGVDTENTRPGT